MVDFVDTDRGESNGGGDFMTEDGSRGITEIGVNELSRDDPVAEEGLSIGEVGI